MNNNQKHPVQEIDEKVLVDKRELRRLYRQIADYQSKIDYYQRLEKDWLQRSSKEIRQLSYE